MLNLLLKQLEVLLEHKVIKDFKDLQELQGFKEIQDQLALKVIKV